jgi:hypothetical protein
MCGSWEAGNSPALTLRISVTNPALGAGSMAGVFKRTGVVAIAGHCMREV